MSFGRYMKLIAHTVTSDAAGLACAGQIREGLDNFIRGVYGNAGKSNWNVYSLETGDGFEEIAAEFYEILGGSPEERVREILTPVEQLQNGSYAMLLGDSDFGVTETACWGAAAFRQIEQAEGFVWSTDNPLCFEKTFTAEEIAGVLGCDAEDAADEAEEQANALAEALLPAALWELLPDDDDDDESPFKMAEYESYDKTLRLLLGQLEHPHELLTAIRDAYAAGMADGWTLRLADAAEENGQLRNVMICPEENAYLEFSASPGQIGEWKVMQLQV